MRTTPFRDVLWSVARKAGYSPESGNFITNQAIAIGEYINDWVSRIYAQEDWPEWTKQLQVVVPSSHIVPYVRAQSPANDPDALAPYNIGRVLTVYLEEPRTTRAPISTRFTLRDTGIHVGFEHGTWVWIKYLEPPPTFTAVVWRNNFTYSKDQVVYAPVTGECYKSLVNNNRNHDPALNQNPLPDLTIELVQQLVPADAGLPAQDEIIECRVSPANSSASITDPVPNMDGFFLSIYDTAGALLAEHQVNQSVLNLSIEDMLDLLKTDFDGDALVGFTFTVTAPNKFTITSTTTEFVIKSWKYVDAPGNSFPMEFVQTQAFFAGASAADITPKVLKMMIGDNAFIPGALYTLTVTDLDGSEHIVKYQSSVFDNKLQILHGLITELGAATGDTTLASIGTSLNSVEPSASLSLIRELGVNVQAAPPASQFWVLVPFPAALVESVVRGASATLMGEWGQTDKESVTEAKVPAEVAGSRGDFETTPVAPLTSQQRPFSRYKV